MAKWPMLIPPLVFAGLAGVFLWGMGRENPTALPSTLVGSQAPVLALGPMAEAPLLAPPMLADGRVKLVNFWASWCAPCRVEHPHLQALAAEGVPIYGVNYKDKPAQAAAFLAELGSPYSALGADQTGRMALEWGVYGVPETFVVDGAGKVLLRYAGPVTREVYEAKIRPLMP